MHEPDNTQPPATASDDIVQMRQFGGEVHRLNDAIVQSCGALTETPHAAGLRAASEAIYAEMHGAETNGGWRPLIVAEAAVAAYHRAAPRVLGWISIGTAEKDETPRDLWVVWRDTGQGERVPDGYWGTSTLPFEYDTGEGWIDPRGGVDGAAALIDVDDREVTHWMPIPEGPSA